VGKEGAGAEQDRERNSNERSCHRITPGRRNHRQLELAQNNTIQNFDRQPVAGIPPECQRVDTWKSRML
jgi:hypothetical protein